MTQNQIAYHNAKELERHNKATEQETSRHQMMQEALSRWSNALQNYQIAVNNAHYVRQDAETARANRARESQNAVALAETQRSNVANEKLKAQANAIQAASVQETSRHQLAMEGIQSSLNDALIEKYGAETGYTEEKTKTEGVTRTYLIPSQAEVNKSQSDLNAQRTQTEYTQRFANIMSGFGSGARAIRDLGGLVTDIFSLGQGGNSSSLTDADKSRQFWKQLEVQVK